MIFLIVEKKKNKYIHMYKHMYMYANVHIAARRKMYLRATPRPSFFMANLIHQRGIKRVLQSWG